MNRDLGFYLSIVLFYISFAWFVNEKTREYPYVRRISKFDSYKWRSPHIRVSVYAFSYLFFWIIISSISFYLYDKYLNGFHYFSLIFGPLLYYMAPHFISPALTLFIFWRVPDDPMIEDPKFPFKIDFIAYRKTKNCKKQFFLMLLMAILTISFLPLLFIFLSLVKYRNFGVKMNMQDIGSIALILTLFAVLWYAWETRKLWKEQVKHTELSLRPFVIVTYVEREQKFKLINLGNTPALNVKIDDIALIDEKGFNFNYVFPEIDLIPQHTQVDIKDIRKKINDEILDSDTFDLGALIPRSAQRTFNVIIRYKNNLDDKYLTEGKLGEGTFDFTRIEKIS